MQNTTTKEKGININIPITISIIMLVLAVPSIWPYGYYQILKWVVFGTAALASYRSYSLEKQNWTWVMGIIAVLFNPIFPIFLDKGMWIVIDLVVAVIFFKFLKDR